MRCVVSVTSLEVVFHKSYVYFSGAAFLTCDGGLVLRDDWRQFPLSGLVFFCGQLQALVSFVLVLFSVSLMCLDGFKMHLSWLSMICLALFMQL